MKRKLIFRVENSLAPRTLRSVNKGLFLVLLVSVLYSISFIINLLGLPVSYGFLGTATLMSLSTWPVIFCLLVPLLFANELRKRQQFFLMLFLPYWSFLIYMSGAGLPAVGLYLPSLVVPFIVLIAAHSLLEIVTMDKIAKIMPLTLIVLLVTSLVPTIIAVNKMRNIKIEQSIARDRKVAEKKDQLLEKCNRVVLKDQGDLSRDVCFMEAAFEARDISFCEKIANQESMNKQNCLNSFR